MTPEARAQRLAGLQNQLATAEERRTELDQRAEDGRLRLVTTTDPLEDQRLRDSLRTLDAEITRLTDKISQLQREQADLAKEDLQHRARACEGADALEQALDHWKHLLELEPHSVAAVESIKRIQDSLELKRKLKTLLDGIGPMLMAHDTKTFMQVARILSTAHKSVTNIVPEVVLAQRLWDRQISLEDFEQALQSHESPVASADKETLNVDFPALSGRIARGEMVIFLGSIAQSPDDLADRLAQVLGARVAQARQQRSLPPSEIAEYFEMRTEYGPVNLVRRVSDILPQDANGTRLFVLLSRVELPLLVISASHDHLLEASFAATRKKYVVVSSVVDGTAELPAGHVILKYSDRATAEVPMPEQSLSREAPIENGYSVLYKLRGVCDGAASVSDPIHRTFTLSEARHFAFARNVDKLIPSYIARQFAGRGLLVLGHTPVFWEDRLVLNSIVERYRSTGERSTVVSLDREGFAGDYWQSRGLSLFSYSLADFVAELESSMA